MRFLLLFSVSAAVAGVLGLPLSALLGIGLYNDTPGSPPLSSQLPVALNLTGPGGHVLLFFEFTFSPPSPPLPAPWQVAALSQACALGLRPVVRLGQPSRNYRDFADAGSNRTRFSALALAYVHFTAALRAAAAHCAAFRVILLNEPNICMEWACTSGAGTFLPAAAAAAEFAAFARDAGGAFAAAALPGVRVAMAAVAGTGFSSCECVWNGRHSPQDTNGTVFTAAMLAAVPGAYAGADFFTVHPYPACGDAPFDAWCARGWLAAYRELYALALPSWRRNASHAGGAWPIVVSETGWQAPHNETGKAQWVVQALELFASDPNVDAVLPFLLAGNFWAPQGWPWTIWSNAAPPQVDALQPQFLAVQALRQPAVVVGH